MPLECVLRYLRGETLGWERIYILGSNKIAPIGFKIDSLISGSSELFCLKEKAPKEIFKASVHKS